MLLHAFQEHVIVSQGSFPSNQTDIGLITSKMSAIVDLRQVLNIFLVSSYDLFFYLINYDLCNSYHFSVIFDLSC